jgi:hypothetical protein
MMVKGTNRHLVIDPFLVFHQRLLLILLWALLVGLLCTQIKTYWRNQGCGKGLLQEWYILLAPTISIYDGQGNQLSLGHRSILGIPPVTYARSNVGTISCCALKYKPTGGPKDVPRVSRNGGLLF